MLDENEVFKVLSNLLIAELKELEDAPCSAANHRSFAYNILANAANKDLKEFLNPDQYDLLKDYLDIYNAEN